MTATCSRHCSSRPTRRGRFKAKEVEQVSVLN
jgi:hypothetical protein